MTQALRRLAASIALAVALWPHAAPAATLRQGRLVMGTILEITLVTEHDEDAAQLLEWAFAEARRWDDILTVWRPQGELARFNALAGSGPVPISGDLHWALKRMIALTAQTGGAFDPAIRPLVRHWENPAALPLPRLPAHRITTVLHLEDGRAALASGAALDSGAIGKGIALDAIAAEFRRRRAGAAFLNFGGSSQVGIGTPPSSPRGWPVLVAGLEPGSVRGTIFLKDATLSTSRVVPGSTEGGVIIDPVQARPVEHARVATVYGEDAAATDAWSTALVVLGAAGIARAAAAGLEVFFEDAGGPQFTGGFPERIAP